MYTFFLSRKVVLLILLIVPFLPSIHYALLLRSSFVISWFSRSDSIILAPIDLIKMYMLCLYTDWNSQCHTVYHYMKHIELHVFTRTKEAFPWASYFIVHWWCNYLLSFADIMIILLLKEQTSGQQCENEDMGPLMLNAFDLIILSQGLNLSTLFDRGQVLA